jgi:hypothetical protein
MYGSTPQKWGWKMVQFRFRQSERIMHWGCRMDHSAPPCAIPSRQRNQGHLTISERDMKKVPYRREGGSGGSGWPFWYGKSRTSRLEKFFYIHSKIFFACWTWLGCILLRTVCGALRTNCGLQETEYRGDKKISILVGVSRLKFLRAISTLKSAQT